jgi:hypothetical protein
VAERVAGPDFVAASKPFLQEQNSIMTGRVAGPQADKFHRLAIVPGRRLRDERDEPGSLGANAHGLSS